MSNVTTIKLEGNQESVTEIQTYLESFNKEIEGGTGEQLQHVQCKYQWQWQYYSWIMLFQDKNYQNWFVTFQYNKLRGLQEKMVERTLLIRMASIITKLVEMTHLFSHKCRYKK